MKRFKKDFPLKLEGIDFKTLEKSRYSIYGLSKDLKLIYYNPAWVKFARENALDDDVVHRFPLGTPIENAIGGKKVKEFYMTNYRTVIESGKVWHHEYECSSNSEFRQFHQITYPLKNGEGLLVMNTLMVDIPMADLNRRAFSALEERYTQPSGLIVQCSNCRRTQRANDSKVWDWVPAWVKFRPKNISHSICPICYDYHWKYSND